MIQSPLNQILLFYVVNLISIDYQIEAYSFKQTLRIPLVCRATYETQFDVFFFN